MNELEELIKYRYNVEKVDKDTLIEIVNFLEKKNLKQGCWIKRHNDNLFSINNFLSSHNLDIANYENYEIALNLYIGKITRHIEKLQNKIARVISYAKSVYLENNKINTFDALWKIMDMDKEAWK